LQNFERYTILSVSDRPVIGCVSLDFPEYECQVFLYLFFYDFQLSEICPQEKKEWREVIEKRLLMPTFADEDTLLFPEDPLGRHGPR
jgi:hypothetical protein